MAVLRRLRQLGVSVFIDDLGIGYSSMNALRHFPVDGIKIDPSFVAEVTSNPAVATITAGLIGITKGLGLEVVAEGVETREQVEFLHSRGCHKMQGYFFAKPVGAAEFAECVARDDARWEEVLRECRID